MTGYHTTTKSGSSNMSEYPLCLVNKIIKKVTMCQLFN